MSHKNPPFDLTATFAYLAAIIADIAANNTLAASNNALAAAIKLSTDQIVYNLEAGKIPTTSGWGNTPTNLGNFTDNKETTSTGQGLTAMNVSSTIYITIDLGAIFNLSYIFLSDTVGATDACTADETLEVSDDNSEWHSYFINSASNNQKTFNNFILIARKARYVRLKFVVASNIGKYVNWTGTTIVVNGVF